MDCRDAPPVSGAHEHHQLGGLLVDKVVEIVPSKSIVAVKNVTCNEQFFQGHFPEWKIMPGVLIVEAMAQAGAVLLFGSIPDPETKFIVMSKIDKAKFKRMVVPGDQLRLDVECTVEGEDLPDEGQGVRRGRAGCRGRDLRDRPRYLEVKPAIT